MSCFVNIIRKMELPHTLLLPASHCIKCFFILLEFSHCQSHSAVKLELQTEILHFHLQQCYKIPFSHISKGENKLVVLVMAEGQ